MKKIYKLKNYRYDDWTYLKEEDAQEKYKNNNPLRRVACGFYSKELNFEEWLNYYRVKIL